MGPCQGPNPELRKAQSPKTLSRKSQKAALLVPAPPFANSLCMKPKAYKKPWAFYSKIVGFIFKGCARQREFVHRAVVPPILAPQKPASWASAGCPGPEWGRRAPLMLITRAPAVRITRSRPRAEAASSKLLALHRAVQKHAPNATRNACAFCSHSPANFEFPRPCQRPRRGVHHEHQRDPRDAAKEGRRQWRASLKGFAFTASPSSGGPQPRPQKGPAALPDLMAAANAADPEEQSGTN